MTRSIMTGARASPCRLLRWHLPPRPSAFSPAGSVARVAVPAVSRAPPLALAARGHPRVGPGGCFVDHCDARVSGAPSGRSPASPAAKDNLDVLGFASGAANPLARDPPRPRPRARSRRLPPRRRRLARREDPDGRARVGAHGRKRALRHRRISRAESRPGRVVVEFPPSPSPRDSATSPSARTPRAASASPRVLRHLRFQTHRAVSLAGCVR